MTGADLRAVLTEWKISRRMFVDALALIGYRTETDYIAKWTDRVPETAAKLIEAWAADPRKRPVASKRRNT